MARQFRELENVIHRAFILGMSNLIQAEDLSVGIRNEVTQAQWGLVMGTAAPGRFSGNDQPVESVSWEVAQEFLKKPSSFPRIKLRIGN